MGRFGRDAQGVDVVGLGRDHQLGVGQRGGGVRRGRRTRWPGRVRAGEVEVQPGDVGAQRHVVGRFGEGRLEDGEVRGVGRHDARG